MIHLFLFRILFVCVAIAMCIFLGTVFYFVGFDFNRIGRPNTNPTSRTNTHTQNESAHFKPEFMRSIQICTKMFCAWQSKQCISKICTTYFVAPRFCVCESVCGCDWPCISSIVQQINGWTNKNKEKNKNWNQNMV